MSQNLKTFICTFTVSVEAEGTRGAMLAAEEALASGKGTSKVREDSGKRPGRPAKAVAPTTAE